MDEHPRPPSGQDEIDKMPLALAVRRQEWYRIHAIGEDPLHYGCSGHRFDSPCGSFGVLYVAARPEGAFIETFGQTLGVRNITQKEFESKSIAVLEAGDLALIDLTEEGASRVGVDGRLCTDTHYDGLTRPWAEAFHRHRANADGILFRARHDLGEVVAAIFDRAQTKIRVVDDFDLSQARGKAFIKKAIDHYGFGIIP